MRKQLNQINYILDKSQKTKLGILGFLLLIGMILEIFSLGLIFPALTFIQNPNKIFEFNLLKPFEDIFSNFSNKELVFLLLLVIVLTYFVKTVFLIILNLKQNRFLANLNSSISNKLLKNYLSLDYIKIVKKDISKLYKNVKVETGYFNTYCQALLNLLTELFLLLSVVVTLIIIEPIGAIFLGLFFTFLSSLFYFFTKKKLTYWGDLRQKLDESTSKTILDGLSGVKELKLLGKTDYYTERYVNDNYLSARVSSNFSTISQFPRYYLEFSSILGLVLFLIVLLLKNQVTENIMATLGVFVAATFRILPSINKVIQSIQNLKFYKSSISLLFNELNENQTDSLIFNTDSFSNFEFKRVQFSNVSFSYNKGSKKILNNVSFELKKGDSIGIIGESGSGKTTLVNILSGLIEPDKGQVLVNDIDIKEMLNIWFKTFSYVSQEVFMINDTIKQNVVLGQDILSIDDKSIEDILKQVQLDSLVFDSKNGINTSIGDRGIQISGGQRQRIGLARALFRDFSVLILDEATSALDSNTEIEIMKTIDSIKSDKSVIMISHNVNLLKDCDKIFELNNGNLKQVSI